MVRGNTTLDITMSLGGFVNQTPLGSFYTYTRFNTPIHLEGEMFFDTLYLREIGTDSTGTFMFDNFNAVDTVLTGYWYMEPDSGDSYQVTLIKE